MFFVRILTDCNIPTLLRKNKGWILDITNNNNTTLNERIFLQKELWRCIGHVEDLTTLTKQRMKCLEL